MAARAIWKGVLNVGSSNVPVKLYAAVEDRKVRFHVLENKTNTRVRQRMVRDTGEEIARDETRKGFEIEPGTFVIVEDAELERLKPQESRDIETMRFVPPLQISNEWYERPYYLGPDGDEDSKYFGLVEALQEADLTGIVRWSMRGKSYVGALTTEGDHLLLVKMRFAEEVLPMRGLKAPDGPALDPKELRMAQELVSALEGTFEPEEFHDDYRERVVTFVEAKAKGKHPRLPTIKERPTGASLNDLLAWSLAALKRGRVKKVA
jgi:DNA end-binding protein Ku